MITTEQIEQIENKVKEIEPLLNKVLDDLNIPKEQYKSKWVYAYDRRYKECTHLWVTLDNLKSSLRWYKVQGLVDIEVKGD